MKDLLEYIVKALVNNPDAVVIEETSDSGNINLELTVHPDDMGLIIGKGGATIHAIRKLLTVRAIAENIRINLHLNESGEDHRDQEIGSPNEETVETPKEDIPEEAE